MARSKGIALTEKQRISWLRLIRSDNVGPVTFRELINHFGSAETALAMIPELSAKGGSSRAIRIASESEAMAELDAARRHKARFIGIGEPEYPQALRTIDGAPPLLAVKGNTNVLNQPSLGIVGSRNASVSGAKIAAMIANATGREGFLIISGLARGIDTAAHKASLETGTIAAMAGGLDKPYPSENIPLYNAICNGLGAAVSEMPFGWQARARDFPRRNRLIAGISLATVVIEAANRSGSLITARCAVDFGRVVFAVPGSPLDPRCQGTNQLLKNGATIVTSPEDVLEDLRPMVQGNLFTIQKAEEPEEDLRPSPNYDPPGDDSRTAISDALSSSPTEIDDIIRHTQLPAQTVHYVLLELDLAGRLVRHSNGTVSINYSG